MIRNILAAVLFLGATSLSAQLNMSLVGQLNYQDLRDSDVSDIWGYVDEFGNEYALVGVNGGGVSVVSLADPANPEEIFYYEGPGSIWRDLKVWNDHAYVTTEGGGGLAIVDLSPLPQSTELTAQSWTGGGWGSAHNLYIDENGIAYISGADRGNGGVIFLDLTIDPFVPVEVGEFDNWYSHDCMTRGDTMYAAHVSDGFFSIVDVSNKQAPVLLGTRNTGNNFTHNCWVSDDGNYLYTTDEVSGGWLGSYDISDPTDIQELQIFRSDPTSNTIPHNTHFINEFVVTSYYRLGTTIHDVSRPWNVVEVARYDHSGFTGDGFNGCWGTYPWLPSGRIISSDIEEGLIVLDPVYVRACWLEGVVRNAQTTAPVGSATVTIVGTQAVDVTTFDGVHASGTVDAGTYQVAVSAPGFQSVVISDVVLVNGEVTMLDIDLQPLVSFALAGQVVEELTGTGVPGGIVQFVGEELSFSAVANGQGDYLLPAIFVGNYELTAGQWGWRTSCPGAVSLSADVSPFQVELAPGYADDFALDLGWTVQGSATNGAWERGIPQGTSFNGQASNPGVDVAGDCGGQAYVTGNGGGGAGDDDLDGGSTTLTSPLFDVSDMVDPYVNYDRWFFNAGGNSAANDRLLISLSNGLTTVVVETVTATTPGMGTWRSSSIRIADFLTPTDQMRFIAWATDDNPGHLVEAGLDDLEVVDNGTVGQVERTSRNDLRVWPNPSSGHIQVALETDGPATVDVLNSLGSLVSTHQVLVSGTAVVELSLPAGTYVLQMENTEGVFRSKPVVIVY